MIETLGCLLVEAREASWLSAEANSIHRSRAGAWVGSASGLSNIGASAAGTSAYGTLDGERSGVLRSSAVGVDGSHRSDDDDRSSAHSRPLASRTLAGKPLIDWVLRRASEAQLLQGLVVILPAGAGLDPFKETLPSGVTVFESGAPDQLGRICDCLTEFPARGIINLRLDCPLLDPCLLDRLVSSVQADAAVDYATYRSADSPEKSRLQSLLNARMGLFAEYIRADVLRSLNRQLSKPAERDDFSSFICTHAEQYLLKLISLPRELDRDDLRLALRHQDDWDHAEQIIEALGGEDLDWQRIVSLLQQQPHLRQRMADLNRADLKNVPR